MRLLVAQLPCPETIRARAPGAELVPFDGTTTGPNGWDDLHRELEPLFRELDGQFASEWGFFDVWSHYLVSEINHTLALTRFLQRLVREHAPEQIYVYLPYFHPRGLALAETLALIQGEVGVPIHDLGG
jgi:hypothetical protein